MTFLDALLKSFYSGDLKLVCNLTWIAFFFHCEQLVCIYSKVSFSLEGTSNTYRTMQDEKDNSFQ